MKEKQDIILIIATLTQRVQALQEKVDFLCRTTGQCDLISSTHNDLLGKTPISKKAQILMKEEKTGQ